MWGCTYPPVNRGTSKGKTCANTFVYVVLNHCGSVNVV